jgi:hypothetical protein
MSIPRPPNPAKLVIGLITKEKTLFEPISLELANDYGPVDMVSGWMPFDYTDYYESEMGTPLCRRMMTFEPLIHQEDLRGIKLATNRIEQAFVHDGRRRVNIDPGYLLHERFVLASGKNFSHRIYIGSGIYADLTLIYQRGGFASLPWTYPDYADQPVLELLARIRNKYTLDLKANSL